MSYLDDRYKLIDKSNAELHGWIALQKQGSKEYVAGMQESMRRVAAMEEEMEFLEEKAKEPKMFGKVWKGAKGFIFGQPQAQAPQAPVTEPIGE